jgi:hypothetical protein
VPKTQEDIQERAREKLVQKAIRANRAANRSNKGGKTVKKKSAKKTHSLVDPVVADDPGTLPPIMQRRANNIARNNEVLATLGLLHRGAPLQMEESSSSGSEDETGNQDGNDEEDDMNAELVNQGEAVVEILSKRSEGRSVLLTVKWDTVGVSDAPLLAVRTDFPDLVKTLYSKERRERQGSPPQPPLQVLRRRSEGLKINCNHPGYAPAGTQISLPLSRRMTQGTGMQVAPTMVGCATCVGTTHVRFQRRSHHISVWMH